MYVTLVNQRTGELKNIKVGFSWVLFLFSGLLGIPLFLRRLHVWGAVFLVLWVVYVFGPSFLPNTEHAYGTYLGICLVFLALQIWVGVKGNEMTAKNLLENGWSFAEPTSQMTRFAIAKWGLSQHWISKNREVQVAPPICETNAEKIPPALKEPISPVSVHPTPPQGFAEPTAPITSPVGFPDSAPKSKSSNTLFGILAAVVTALFALFVGFLIGTHSKSPLPNDTPAPVGRAEIVASETPSTSPAVQVHQEDSSVNTVDSKSPVPNETPSPSFESSTTQSASGGVAESQSQVAASPNTTPQSIEVRRAEIVAPGAPSGSLGVQAPQEDSFVNTVVRWISTGNGSSLIRYTADNLVNYFGSTHMSNDIIEEDVSGTAHVRHMSKSLEIAHEYLFHAPVLDTQRFTHEVSNEYSKNWVGPMLYDSIDVHTEKGWVRFTVGYTFGNGTTSIYALVLKVL